MKILTGIFLIFFSLYGRAQLIHDESYKDPDFWKFKTQLEDIILNRDTARLREVLADTIRESNDGCGHPGCLKDEFLEMYFQNGAAESSWEEMQIILRFGFTSGKDVFSGPSYLIALDTENELLVLGENINIREKPGLQAKIIAQASFEKFKCDCNITTMTDSTYQEVDGIAWVEIKLKDGKTGYIASKFTSYFWTKEMTIAKVKGEWKIISFYHKPGC